jgi:hypothetical protein
MTGVFVAWCGVAGAGRRNIWSGMEMDEKDVDERRGCRCVGPFSPCESKDPRLVSGLLSDRYRHETI